MHKIIIVAVTCLAMLGGQVMAANNYFKPKELEQMTGQDLAVALERFGPPTTDYAYRGRQYLRWFRPADELLRACAWTLVVESNVIVRSDYDKFGC